MEAEGETTVMMSHWTADYRVAMLTLQGVEISGLANAILALKDFEM